ncbi:MAG: CARDB domain-containing protein [Parafilimonas sp.]
MTFSCNISAPSVKISISLSLIKSWLLYRASRYAFSSSVSNRFSSAASGENKYRISSAQRVNGFFNSVKQCDFTQQTTQQPITSDDHNAGSTTTPGTTSGNVDATDTQLIVKPPEEKKPDISISSFSISPSEITLDADAKPKTITATIEAYNSGNALAENCIFTLTSDGGVIGNASSPSFSLDAGEKKQFSVSFTISNSGNITAKLDCSNDAERISPPFYITVYSYGTIHHVIPNTQ